MSLWCLKGRKEEMKSTSLECIVAAVILLIASLCAAGCKDKPCHGGGKIKDERPLPAAWKKLDVIPAGGHMCTFTDSKNTGVNTRHFEFFGHSPKSAFKKWRSHLKSKGFSEMSLETDDHGYKLVAAKEGYKLEVYVSKAVKKKGWVTVSLFPAASPSR